MQHDKKVIGGRVIGVWPVRIGEVVIRPIEQQVCAAWFQCKHGRGDADRCQVATSSQARYLSGSKGSCPKVNLNDDQTGRHLWLTSNRHCGKKHAKSMCSIGSLRRSATNWISKPFSNISSKLSSKSPRRMPASSTYCRIARTKLILRASKNPHPKLIGRITIGLGEGITGWVAQERTRVVIPNNANDDPRFKFFHNLPEDRHQAFVSVPIMAKKEVVGVINVQHKRPKRYRPDELELLSTIANQVGGAID